MKLKSINPNSFFPIWIDNKYKYIIKMAIFIRVRLRFFYQVGHQTTNASIGNKYSFTK